MSITIKLNDPLKNLKQKVEDLSKNNMVLKVGFLDAKIANIAQKNEYGGIYKVDPEYKNRALKKGVHLGDDIAIIPRPFMQTTVDKNKNKWKEILNNLLKNKTPDKALGTLGEVIKADIQYTISNNDFEKNPPHIAQIKGRNKPLIDTGKMRNKVDYEIK